MIRSFYDRIRSERRSEVFGSELAEFKVGALPFLKTVPASFLP